MADSERTIDAVFNRDSLDYDFHRRNLIPCFDEFYGTALQLIRDWYQDVEDLHVLDIGAGTGLVSAMIRETFPKACFRLIDASADMIEQARDRFSDFEHIEFCVADMRSAELGNGWDLIVSALAIHHLENVEKKALFERIKTALRPGGLFVNAEQVAGPTQSLDERYERLWLSSVHSSGLPPSEIQKAQERMSFDRCATVEDQLNWMSEAGLVDVDCSFKSWRFAVLSGGA